MIDVLAKLRLCSNTLKTVLSLIETSTCINCRNMGLVTKKGCIDCDYKKIKDCLLDTLAKLK